MTVQNAPITDPKLADRILRFLLSEETTAFPARILAQRIFANTQETEEHIAAINQVKARWIYEIPQPEGKESFYIIGNCKMHIKEHLRKGGFQHLFELGNDAPGKKWQVADSVLGRKQKLLRRKRKMLIALVITLVAAAVICIAC